MDSRSDGLQDIHPSYLRAHFFFFRSKQKRPVPASAAAAGEANPLDAMARIKRHAATRRLSRRSKEDKRRLSEGGGGTARAEETAEEDAKRDPTVDIMEMETEEIDQAYRRVFQYDEVEASLLTREQEIVEAIEELNETKASLGDKISALKTVTRSSDSDNVKRIKHATRRISEIMDRIGELQKELVEVKFSQTTEQVRYRSSLAVVNQNLAGQEASEGLLLGFLGHVWRLA